MGGETRISSDLVLGVVRATEAAAIATYDQIGRGDEFRADQAAVEAMRLHLNEMAMAGRIVIGEGERDQAPMLFIGEEVGTGQGTAIDIAVDPLEGTTLTAKARGNALSVAALAHRDHLLHAPDVYMEKIAIGANYPDDIVLLDRSPADNIKALAKAKGVATQEITACILDRPRHSEIIEQVRKAGAAIQLISDGDIAGVIQAAQGQDIDIYIGIGGAPEGVLAAAALHCIGGQMQTRLILDTQEKKNRAAQMGITDPDRIYRIADMVRGDIVFAATGVTAGSLLAPCRRTAKGKWQTHSLLLHAMGAESCYLSTTHAA